MAINYPEFPILSASQMGSPDISSAMLKPVGDISDAMSKLAYARLMGPQFLAKLMQNQDFVANMPDPQRKAIVSTLPSVAMGGASSQDDSILDHIANGIKSLFTGKSSDSKPNLPSQNNDQNGEAASSRDSGTDVYTTAPSSSSDTDIGAAAGFARNSPQAMAINAYAHDPDVLEKAKKDGLLRIPEVPEVMKWYNAKYGNNPSMPSASSMMRSQDSPDYFQKAGIERGLKTKETELGKLSASNINELDKDYEEGLKLSVPVNNLARMIGSPDFQRLRRFPFFQDTQLKLLSKIGTPAEQKMLGEFVTNAQSVVANTVNSFKGRAMAKEFDLADSMKVSKNDTANTAIGKILATKTMNDMAMQRSRLASRLMKSQNMTRGDAIEAADSMIDGEKIRKQAENMVNPPPSDSDIVYMMNKYKVPREEIIRRLKQKGYSI